jgi:hypothetical protein
MEISVYRSPRAAVQIADLPENTPGKTLTKILASIRPKTNSADPED